MASCNVINNAQMMIIGGAYTDDQKYECDVDTIMGQHNMDLGMQNDNNAIWEAYKPEKTAYVVPSFIQSAVGGEATGGATEKAPEKGFDSPDLKVLMTRTAKTTERQPTRDVSLATSSSDSDKSGTASPGLNTGAIAGIAVGAAVILIAAITGCCCLIRRRQQHYKMPRRGDTVVNGPHAPPSNNAPLPSTPGGWTGAPPTPSLHVTSPTLTHASYANRSGVPSPAAPVYATPIRSIPPPVPVRPDEPVELATENWARRMTAMAAASQHHNSSRYGESPKSEEAGEPNPWDNLSSARGNPRRFHGNAGHEYAVESVYSSHSVVRAPSPSAHHGGPAPPYFPSSGGGHGNSSPGGHSSGGRGTTRSPPPPPPTRQLSQLHSAQGYHGHAPRRELSQRSLAESVWDDAPPPVYPLNPPNHHRRTQSSQAQAWNVI